MSFTNQKPFVVTDEHLSTPWGGYRDCRKFRCRLCGDFFGIGTTARFVIANNREGHDAGVRHGNFFVCVNCDGVDVLVRAAAQEVEAARRFWFVFDPEELPRHPEAKPARGPRR